MKSVEINNETSRDLHVKVIIKMKTLEVKDRTVRFVPIDEAKEIDTIAVSIKE